MSTSTTPTETTTFGLAIVGCGQIVTHHLDAIAALSKNQDASRASIQVRALCDPSAERRAVLANLPAVSVLSSDTTTAIAQYETVQELIQDDVTLNTVDFIFIAVPHDLHEELAMTCLKQTTRQTIIMEKPLAPTLEACQRLVQASSENLGRLIIAEQSPYWPAVVQARHLIHDENAIGTLVAAAGYYYESMRTNVTSGSVDATSGALGWRGSIARAGGGIAIDGGLHWLRPLREVCGRITKVVGTTRSRLLPPAMELEGESVAHALLEMEQEESSSSTIPSSLQQVDGAGPLVATYSCNLLATAPMAHDMCPYFRFTGTQGELVIRGNGLLQEQPGAGGLVLYNENHPTGRDMLDPNQVGGFFGGFQGLWHEISRMVTERDAAAAHQSVVRASDDVRVVLALYRSASSRTWEET
uniref:Gfo/Idh/MocA-like oxidoreductase N-terminal domain-containing protein n=1 Tax=Entomoneis paludosa TaxID=265537 RepID=A0A7S3DMI0_9STRA